MQCSIEKFSFVSIALLCSILSLASVGCQKAAPPKKTQKALMEQAAGKKYHWDQHGEAVGRFSSFSTGNARTYAMHELGEKGNEQALPLLIRIFEREDDKVTEDHFTVRLRSEAAIAIGKIGSQDTIVNLVQVLIDRALKKDRPWEKHPTDPRWHSSKEPTSWGRRDRDGIGPQGIVMALLLFPEQHYEKIENELRGVKLKIEACDLDNRWALRELERAFRFFKAERASQEKAIHALRARRWWRMSYLDDQKWGNRFLD